MANHAGEALLFVAHGGVFDAVHAHLSGCAWALKARFTIRCSPNSIWVAAQNHGRMIAILIEPLNFAAITSCANVVQLQCCVTPARPLLREQEA
jgi:hypothetical protein